MELIRGGERACGQEVCGEVELRSGAARGVVTSGGKHPAQLLPKAPEGGRVGCGRRLERQLDLQGAGHQLNNIGRLRRRLVEEGGGAEAQTQSELRPATDFRRGGGGEIDRLDLLAGARGFDRWSLRLLEKVVELNIVENASDNTPEAAQSRLPAGVCG